MDFQFSSDQQLFRDTLRRCLADHPRVPTPRGSNPADWALPQGRQLAELGVQALLLPEVDGGLGLGAVEAMIVGEELGRAVLATPFIETVVIAGGLIAALGTEGQRSRLLPRIASGEAIIAVAGRVRSAMGRPLVYRRSGSHFSVSGEADIVTFAPVANHILLIADDEAGNGLSAFLLDRNEFPAFEKSFWSVDDLPLASLKLDNYPVSADQMVGRAGEVRRAIDEPLALAVVVQAAELVGIMATLLNAVLDQLRTRKQFGALLASFQALQHRLADMSLAYEQALSLTLKAAAILSSKQATDYERAICAVKVQTARSARLIGHEAVQLHGAMGMTEELVVGPALRRVRAIEPRLGTPNHFLDRYRRLRASI